MDQIHRTRTFWRTSHESGVDCAEDEVTPADMIQKIRRMQEVSAVLNVEPEFMRELEQIYDDVRFEMLSNPLAFITVLHNTTPSTEKPKPTNVLPKAVRKIDFNL